MRQDCLSVFSVVAVFSYLCLVKGTEGSGILRRWLSTSLHHSTGCLHGCLHGLCETHLDTAQCRCDHGWTGSRCDVHIDCHHCLHGSCSSFTGHCRCHDGWTGTACDEPVDVGTCRHSSDCHTVIRCDLNTKAICYFGQMCACVPIHDDDRRTRFINGDVNGVYQYGGVQYGNGGVQYGKGGVQYGNGGVLFGGIQNNNPQQTVGRGSYCGPYYCTHGSCQYTKMNGVETHSCTCSHGWHGDHCDQPDHVTSFHAKDCTNHQCFHGHCERDVYNNEHCKCNDGWTGYQCHINVAQTGPLDHCNNHCGEHGTCTMHQSQDGHHYWSCKCDYGWHGDHCRDQYIVPTTTTTTTTTSKPDTMMGKNSNYDKECNYHGSWSHHHSECHCHDQWWGDRCEYSPGSGPHDHCNNHCGEHGTCTMHHAPNGHEYWRCKCNYGWFGDHCTDQYQYIVTDASHCHNCVNGDCTYFENTNGHQWHHRCKCHHGWDGDNCDNKITTSSLSPSTTTTTTSPTTTTKTTTTPATTTKQASLPPASATSPAVPTLSVAHISTTNTPQTQTTAITVATCNHVDTLSAIAQQTSVANQNAIECSPGVHTSHEALVLTDCSVSQSPALWKQGINVMSACSSNAIPNYTPIAAFDHGQYSSIGSLSGIFLGCTSNGFKMVVQTCGQTPYIAELHLGGSNTQNPNMYFTIS